MTSVSGGSKYKVWQNATKGTQVTDWDWDLSEAEEPPETLYVEGYDASSSVRDVHLKLQYNYPDVPCQGEICNDAVKATVFGGRIESLDNCGEPYGKYLLLTNPVASSPTEQYRATLPQPSGTTYKWEISSGGTNAHIVGSDTGSTVTLKADAEGDFTLKLTYTLGDATCIRELNSAAQKPSTTYSFLDCVDWDSYCETEFPYVEAWQDVAYYIRDGSNRPVPHAFWDETWAGGCNLTPGDEYANCSGYFPDHIWIWWPQYCDEAGTICADTQYILIEGWPGAPLYFWIHDVALVDGLPPGSYPYVYHSGCE